MAKKGKSKKDKEDIEKDENINEGTQEDINEADDSFGLPDIDFKPLDEMEDEPVEEQESEEQTIEEEEVSDSAESESASEEDFEEEFVDDSDMTEADASGDSVEEESESNFVPPARRFEHPKESSSAPKIIIGVLIAIIVIAAGWYFGMYKPQQAEKARIEQENARLAEEARQQEEERLAREAREREEAALEEATESEPEPGTIMTISETTGRYYVVIGSFVDEDLAADLANEISASGVTTMILSPVKPKGFTRVALSDYGSWDEAQSAADQMKGEFGEKVWVFKY